MALGQPRSDPAGISPGAGSSCGAALPHLLDVLVEEVQDAVLVLPVPPALHVVVPGAPQHCRRGAVSGPAGNLLQEHSWLRQGGCP